MNDAHFRHDLRNRAERIARALERLAFTAALALGYFGVLAALALADLIGPERSEGPCTARPSQLEQGHSAGTPYTTPANGGFSGEKFPSTSALPTAERQRRRGVRRG